MLLPTVASAILSWKKLGGYFGVDLNRKGIDKGFGHSETIGLDTVHYTVEEMENGMLVICTQTAWDTPMGQCGGPGKFDIDHGARISGMNLAIAALAREADLSR
ncbi:MAG: hypothetical protein WHT46_09710 [Candidatus Geothermincolales bacterium]